MTPPPDPSRADDRPLRVLAYVDGELDPPARAAVEAELAADPELAELARDLEQTGPANRELWAAVAPPQPGEAAWERVRVAIAASRPTAEPKPSRGRRVAWVAVAVGLAAGLLLAAGVWFKPQSKPPEAPGTPAAVDPLAEYADLPIATPDEVMVSAVRGGADLGFVACKHPLDGMRMAATAELTVWHPQTGEGITMPGDAPVFADLDK